MATQLVFLTLFLGLISGRQHVELQPGPAVKSIHILLDGKQVAALQHAPWSTTVDFGPSIAPGELVAVGYDARGDEVARASQTVNLPRPFADFVIAVKNDAKGTPVSAELRWEHLQGAKPVKSSLKVDGKVVPLDANLRAKLPRLDVNQPHVLAASMQFEDGFAPRRELVIGGGVGDTAESLLTAVAVRQPPGNADPAHPSDCFTSGGSPVRVSALEKSEAHVIVVVDPDPRDAMKALDLRMTPSMMLGPHVTDEHHLFSLHTGTWLQLLWPIAERYKTTSNTQAVMFPPSTYVEAQQGGMMWLLTRSYSGHFDKDAPRLFADAAGVAGLDAITGGNRRAVVVVLDHQNDGSGHAPASIRSYLSSIGVPLYVWSVTGPRPESGWGEIDDISSPAKLKAAVDRLREDLESQRVAWLATDAVAALRVQPTGRCNLTPLARRP